jgi:hypothetical protein
MVSMELFGGACLLSAGWALSIDFNYLYPIVYSVETALKSFQ